MPNTQHGQLTVIDYGDSTPDVTYSYDRRGRRTTAQANGITTTFSYNEADQLTGESWSGGTLNTWNVNPVYDTKLRRSQLLVKLSTTLKIQHDYSYDTASRLQSVWQGSYSANYAYEANSSLIDKVDYKFSTTARLTGDRTYDSLNRLTVMANTPQSGLPVSFAYQYNDANQRIRTVLADGSYWLYEYDQRGQVIRGRRFWADHTPVAGQQFDYAFDDIGNRTSTLAGGDQSGGNQRSASYTRDFLNRYGSRTVPGGFDVLGVGTASSAVTVNSQASYRKGEYFWKQVDVVNTSVPVWQNNTVTVSGGSTTTGNTWVPQTPEAYTYDNDGNTLTDGRWTYTWDAENRLTRLVARTAVGPQQRLDFEYDNQGRRIRKTVYNNTAGTPPAATDLKFLYDGWNLIAEVNAADALVRQYLWGTDLSGSFQGAGGVGGLVKIYDHVSSKTYFPGYDGNGNVALLVDGDTGAAGAVYEYGPFGELIRSSGTYAATCPFRFSTKYQDKETDLLYYGYRYYNPSTGRWLSRDPIEERGGKALYAIAGNNPVSQIDVLGLYGESGHFYTTYLVARAAGRTPEVAYALAYYSQLPDEHPMFEAKFSLFGLAWWGIPIQEELHSLHGTDPKQRRACLKRMIMGRCGGPLRTWEKGFVIHAFADSYAHTNPTTGLLFESPFGHWDPLRAHQGHEYDWISERPRLYMQYMWDLFDALGGTNWFADELRGLVNLLSQIEEGATEETTVRAFRQLAVAKGYDRGYFPEDTYTIHDAISEGHVTPANWLPVPSLWEVRDLIAKIRKCCGCDH